MKSWKSDISLRETKAANTRHSTVIPKHLKDFFLNHTKTYFLSASKSELNGDIICDTISDGGCKDE